jgi:hypothetical protein
MEGRLSGGWCSWLDAAGVVVRVAHFSFGAWCADCWWELPRLVKFHAGPSGGQKQRELAETSVALIVCERAGLKGCWRLRMCRRAIGILRATADLAGFLPLRLAMSL